MRLIGLNEVKRYCANICKDAPIYKYCGLIPESVIIYLDNGNGRSAVCNYVMSMYIDNGIIKPDMDEHLELIFDGTITNLKHNKQTIINSAVYSNHYKGLISIDAMALAGVSGEEQHKQFFELITDNITQFAPVIFFAPYTPTPREEKMIEKIKDVISCTCIRPSKYKSEELAQISLSYIHEHGVALESPKQIETIIKNCIGAAKITTVKSAIKIADMLIRHADFTQSIIPVLNAKTTKEVISIKECALCVTKDGTIQMK